MKLGHLLARVLYVIATRGPVGWVGAWCHRAQMARMRQDLQIRPMRARDVLPWGRMLTPSEAADDAN